MKRHEAIDLAPLRTEPGQRTDLFIDITDAERDSARAAVAAFQWRNVIQSTRPGLRQAAGAFTTESPREGIAL